MGYDMWVNLWGKSKLEISARVNLGANNHLLWTPYVITTGGSPRQAKARGAVPRELGSQFHTATFFSFDGIAGVSRLILTGHHSPTTCHLTADFPILILKLACGLSAFLRCKVVAS